MKKAIILCLVIILTIAWIGFVVSDKEIKQEESEGEVASISCILTYSHAIEPGTAVVSKDLSEFVTWGFFLPDRGLVFIVDTFNNPYAEMCIMVKGGKNARIAELLLLNREAIKWIRRKQIVQ